VWKSHWGLERDPFAESDALYVSLPTHDEAVARLVHTIETAERRALVTANAGLGKSTILRKAFAEMQSPRRRFALVSCTREGTLLFALLAERLAERVGREPSRLASWRALERAIRLASIQGIHVVLGIDDCHFASSDARRDIESLANLGTGTNTLLTVVQAGRRSRARRDDRADRWTLAIRLESLTRSEAETFLATKLARAGCRESPFTARAMTRLHCHCGGVPRGLQQLATRCLMAGASRGLLVMPPELVDGLAEEISGPTPGFLGAA
jgi:type II secretory pathway predicted ATPase ExeA